MLKRIASWLGLYVTRVDWEKYAFKYANFITEKNGEMRKVNTLIDDYNSAKVTINKRMTILSKKHEESQQDIVEAVRYCTASVEFVEFAKAVDQMNRLQAEYIETLLDAIKRADETILEMVTASVVDWDGFYEQN